MAAAHILGFPRIGADRELKHALESYWKGDSDLAKLQDTGKALRQKHWRLQTEAGLERVTVGDFAWYDQVLTHSLMVGAVPERFGDPAKADLETLFYMARGINRNGDSQPACAMTKWFDTNYHYLVPEFSHDQVFRLGWPQLFDEVAEAQALGLTPKPVLLGPLTYLWLGRCVGGDFDRLDLLEPLLAVYAQILAKLAAQGVDWVQIDEPALVLDLPAGWKAAYEAAYNQLQRSPVKLLLTTYFGGLEDNLGLACGLPVAGLHIDLIRAPEQLSAVLDRLPSYKLLSLGLVNGRNVWRCDMERALTLVKQAREHRSGDIWVAPSCSLLHCPVDVTSETELDDELRGWLAFAVQKLEETALLAKAVTAPKDLQVIAALERSSMVQQSRKASIRIHDAQVEQRVAAIQPEHARRGAPYAERAPLQQKRLGLPALPTTTIGSFPQTAAIRAARAGLREGRISEEEYDQAMRAEIASVIHEQEQLGLDVLVHGEAERNDMVEYFGQQLQGYAFSRFGWVQSYGSRCVKPPIIIGDISRPSPMTVGWSTYAQQQTALPVKGMLTGPVTMLMWSFPREDIPPRVSAQQLALAIRDEVVDLEQAGIAIIQIDEPAFREGLPLRKGRQADYLAWAAEAFRLSASGVRDDTQIHTHMCYSEFNGVIDAIAAMDADVITIETSRSAMRLLDAFDSFDYPNAIGPGVYDIHSPRVPNADEMLELLRRAVRLIPLQRLWVNPDCGLKTRGWVEVRQALSGMIEAAQRLRAELGVTHAALSASQEPSTAAAQPVE